MRTTFPFHQLATIGDPDGTRTVTSIIALLVALGIGLAMVAVWLYRTTRPDPELLAPLEVMGERKWRRADPVAQRRTLDEVRPAEARPLEPSVAPPLLDATFDAGPTAGGFDDLHADDLHADDLHADVDADDDDVGSGRIFLPPARQMAPPGADVTPQQLPRPGDDDFATEIDADLLAAAAAELDAELHRRNEPVDD